MLQYTEINLENSRWIHLACNTWLLIADLISTWYMMTSSNRNIFRVTGHLCGEFTGPGEIPAQRPVTRSFDVFFDLHLNKRFSKQSSAWWFETHRAHYDVIVMHWIQTWSWVSPPKHEKCVGILYRWCIFVSFLQYSKGVQLSSSCSQISYWAEHFSWEQADWSAVIFTIWMPKFATLMV